VTRRWFSPGTSVSSTNKTDRHDTTEILLKVALNTINQDGWQKLTNVVKEQNYVIFVLNIKNKGQIKFINQTLVIYTSAK
jgi:hypothetical protein